VQALTPQINLAVMAPGQLVVFIEKQTRECMTPSPSKERNWSQKEPAPCFVYTCGESSKHFIEDMMNLVLLFSYLKFLELWLRQKRLAIVVRALVAKGQSTLLRT